MTVDIRRIFIIFFVVSFFHISAQAQSLHFKPPYSERKMEIKNDSLIITPSPQSFSVPTIPWRNSPKPVYIAEGKSDTTHINIEQTGAQQCNTYTFTAHIKGQNGAVLSLIDIAPVLNRNTIVAVNQNESNKKSVVIFQLSEDGSILKELKLQVNGQSIVGAKMQIRYQNSILIAGYLEAEPNVIFLCSLSMDLQINWVKKFILEDPVEKMSADLNAANAIILTSQHQSKYSVLKLDENGKEQWLTSISRTAETSLQDIYYNVNPEVLIALKAQQNNLPSQHLIALNGNTGKLIESRIIDQQQDSSLLTHFSGFSNRYAAGGILRKKNGTKQIFALHGQVKYESNINYYYETPIPVNSQTIVFFSQSLDAIAAYDSMNKQLYFIYQLYLDDQSPKRQRQFSLNGQQQLSAFIKTIDAGYMFGFNEVNGQILLMKTDSAGIMADCNSNPMIVGFEKASKFDNPIIPTPNQTDLIINTEISNISSVNSSSSISFVCRNKYCPSIPSDDECLSSYLKVMRSTYFSGGVYAGIVQNDLYYTYGQYSEDVGAPDYYGTGIHSIYDLNGNHIKSVKTLINGQQAISNLWPYQKSQTLAAYLSMDANQKLYYTICAYDKDLKSVWTSSLETYYDFNNYVLAPTITSITYDSNGDIYVISTQAELSAIDRIIGVVKLDATGKFIWSRSYQMSNLFIGVNTAVVTPNALVILSECTNPGSFTLALNKDDGNILLKSTFPNNKTNSVIIEPSRLFKYHKGKIYYIGAYEKTNLEGGYFLMAAVMDSYGKPEKMFYYNTGAATRIEASIFDDKIDIVSGVYQNWTLQPLKIQLDLSLNVIYSVTTIPDYFSIVKKVNHDSNGEVYEMGFLTRLDQYYESSNYFKKYDYAGNVGTCTYTPLTTTTNELLNESYSIDLVESPKVFKPGGNFTLQLIEDDNGMQIADILCKSIKTCNLLKLNGPSNFCDPTKNYSIQISKNPGCNASPRLQYDTSIIRDVKQNAGEISFYTNRTGSTWIKALLNTGCELLQDSFFIEVPNASAKLDMGPDRVLCPKDSIALNAGFGYASYKWNTGSSDSAIVVRKAGKYFVEVTDGCRPKQLDSITIIDAVVPILSAGADTSICQANTLTRNTTTGFAFYNWIRRSDNTVLSNNNLVQTIINKDEQFNITARTADGCIAIDSFKVLVKAARIFDLGKDSSICIGDSIQFTAPSFYKSFKWNTGASASSIVAKTAGKYFLTVTDLNDCITSDTVALLNVYPVPVPSLGKDQNLCNGSSLNLNPGSFNRYLWHNGSTQQTFVAKEAGKYAVQVWNQFGCTAIDTLSIQTLLALPANFLKSTDSICKFETLKIEPSIQYANYSWSTGSNDRSIMVSKPGRYVLTVTDQNNCSGSDSIQIFQKTCMEGVYVPSAFTPNQDGLNDKFKPLVFGNVISYEFKVFNGFGEMIFSSTTPGESWDGKWKGIPQASGTFVWKCIYHLEGSEIKQSKGSVSLIR